MRSKRWDNLGKHQAWKRNIQDDLSHPSGCHGRKNVGFRDDEPAGGTYHESQKGAKGGPDERASGKHRSKVAEM